MYVLTETDLMLIKPIFSSSAHSLFHFPTYPVYGGNLTSYHQWNVDGRDILLFGLSSYNQFAFPLISSLPFSFTWMTHI